MKHPTARLQESGSGRSDEARRDAPAPIPVRARIEWERDGGQLLDTVALGWTTWAVRVELINPRWRISAV